jgi:TonB family protein
MRFIILLLCNFLFSLQNVAQDTLVSPFPPARCMAANNPQTDPPLAFTNVNEEPYLKSCISHRDSLTSDIRLCTQNKVITFVYDHLRYPEEGRAEQIEGTVVVCFNIEEDGTIGEEIKIARDLGPGFGREAFRIIELMRTTPDMQWVAARQYGKPVRVRYNLPIKFKP